MFEIRKNANKLILAPPLHHPGHAGGMRKENKMQSMKDANGKTRHRLQSVPEISVISGNMNDDIRQDNYSQGT